MKLLLLFDQNISYKVVSRLEDIYPDSTHVRLEGLDTASDYTVWEFAKNNGFTIVSQDGDFLDISLLRGTPPRIIWLRCGNTSTNHIISILRKNFDLIRAFHESEVEVCLELS